MGLAVSEGNVAPVSWRVLYINAITGMSPGVCFGLLCGAVIGGVGGRLAMFLLRLTSSDALHGVKTDDDFTIGSFTSESFFLLFAASFAGIVGGLAYLAVRDWLPAQGRPLLSALLGGTIGGSLVIHPGGIDFTELQPLSLAVALFVALPALFALTLSALIERYWNSPVLRLSWLRWSAVIGVLLPVLFTGPFGLAILGLLGVTVALNRSGHVRRILRSTPSQWIGRLALISVLLLSGYALARDVSQIL